MAYSEAAVGGSSGGYFRVWVNSIRTYDGSQSENFEDWRVEGGLNRVSGTGGRIWNNYGNSSYTVQLGMNGVASSGNFSYDFNTATGTKVAWGTGSTRVYRDGAGNGFGFQSRMDINLQNSPYLTSGWTTSNDSVQTKPRYGGLSYVNWTGTLTDETPSVTAGWYNYVGQAHIWFRLDAIDNADATYHYVGPANPQTWSGFQTWVQQEMVNTNATALYIHYGDDINWDGWVDHWNGPYTTTISIANESGQANPTFADYDYLDTNAATVAVTGNDQVLIQGKSTLQATVPVADKATPNKNANMAHYLFTLGGYSQSNPWSNTVDVVQNMGVISDVTGIQTLSVRAVDSRGNNKTVTKSVTILPYASPAFVPTLRVKYSNNFDTSSGLTVTANGTNIANISPMTLSSVDKNVVSTTTGVKFDLSKEDNTSYSGSWTNVDITQAAGTGAINTVIADLETAILGKMSAMTEDNTVYWYVKFQITDSLETKTYETVIDIGRPIMRIGTDGYVYFNEVASFHTESIASSSTPTPAGFASLNQYFVTALAANATVAAPTGDPANGNRLMLRIKDNGTARALTWNAIYRVIGAILPTTTTINKVIYVGCVYNSAASKWDVLAVNSEL